MGADAGFDMVPCLSKSAIDTFNWGRFIELIKAQYDDDPKVEVQADRILFKAGEHPSLPIEGHKFLRFSSKITGSTARDSNVEAYIDTVTQIAKANFGSQIYYWNELGDRWGHYDWQQVHDSIRSYEQCDEPDISTSIANLAIGSEHVEELSTPLYEVKQISGKGKGLVARVDIPTGTRILCEKPLLIVGSMPRDELESVLAAKLKTLSITEQRQFLSLHNNHPGRYPFGGITRTNALPCGPGSSIGGIYPTICLINHSCLPNSNQNWNAKAEHETIHANKQIKAGEEITIAYNHEGTRADRQAFLKASFGFDCGCISCSLPHSEQQASDSRRQTIKRLDDAIGDPFLMSTKPKESLKKCRLLLQLINQEYCDSAQVLCARLYYDAFQISVAHGDQARASIFAERARQMRVICEGEDSPETEKVASLALQPGNHPSSGLCSMRWKSKKGMKKEDLDPKQFEDWLWRENI